MFAVTNAILKAGLAGGDGRLPFLSRNDGIDKYPGNPKEKTEAKKTSEQGEVIHFVYPKREEEKIFNSSSQITSEPKAFPCASIPETRLPTAYLARHVLCPLLGWF